MIYSIFAKKTKRDTTPFAINKVLEWYTACVGGDDFIIFLPGYMSNSETKADDYFNNMPVNTNGFFTKGYHNGSIRGRIHGYSTIQEYYNSRLGVNNDLCSTGGEDHSKMMFFLENDDNLRTNIATLNTTRNATNFNRFIEDSRVKAILIGSSNQSYQTYFGTGGSADKGEADILLIDGVTCNITNDTFTNDQFRNYFENYNKKIVISTQISGNYNMLKDIFKQTIRF